MNSENMREAWRLAVQASAILSEFVAHRTTPSVNETQVVYDKVTKAALLLRKEIENDSR